MFEPIEEKKLARIAVIGIGGAGNNAINHMIEAKLTDVEFFAINTDLQALSMNHAENKIQIGAQITGGLGSGGNPDLGRKACEESLEVIKDILTGYDLVFLTCGEGGGTGTGATPLIAEVAKNQGALVIAVVTKPFEFEGEKRMSQAIKGINDLKDKVDTLIVIPNQKLLNVFPEIPCYEAFRLANEVLLNAVRGISDLITKPGLINIDFADVRNVMLERGRTLIASGVASGEGRATTAVQEALNSPLIEELNIKTATKILLNIAGDNSLTLQEINEIASTINRATNGNADIRFGVTRDPSLKNSLRVTLIATGIEESLPTSRELLNLIANSETFIKSASIDKKIVIDKYNFDIPPFIRNQLD
ncbi:MAG: cell division protein FtsZ [candidate division WOR-3 bacterium]|nr:cell division protein FtsZ [candidate division WOR-3 bacterium]MDW7987478.1 cell division protein FtsZ [candidate division WOR-3 bacterium]